MFCALDDMYSAVAADAFPIFEGAEHLARRGRRDAISGGKFGTGFVQDLADGDIHDGNAVLRRFAFGARPTLLGVFVRWMDAVTYADAHALRENLSRGEV